MAPPFQRLSEEYNHVSKPSACNMRLRALTKHGDSDHVHQSVPYKCEEGFIGCLGGGCFQQLLVGSHGVSCVPWHRGDRQERGVSHTLKGFSPMHNDENAWVSEKHIIPASIPG